MVPFLKWAGGKRWMFDQQFIDQLPEFERYVEPFLGGGAGYFALRPASALLSDVNEELINVYRQIAAEPQQISYGLEQLGKKHCKTFYYEMRASEPTEPMARALRTLYLNRTCWNGLYRLNKNGIFNVPIGTKDKISLQSDDFENVSDLLKTAAIEVSDFENVLAKTGMGDLVFVDPPYTVKHNMNGFVKYNESIFTWEDQERLSAAARAAAARGAYVLVANADHSSVRELYHGSRMLQSLPRSSVLAASALYRSKTTELLITV